MRWTYISNPDHWYETMTNRLIHNKKQAIWILVIIVRNFKTLKNVCTLSTTFWALRLLARSFAPLLSSFLFRWAYFCCLPYVNSRILRQYLITIDNYFCDATYSWSYWSLRMDNWNSLKETEVFCRRNSCGNGFQFLFFIRAWILG